MTKTTKGQKLKVPPHSIEAEISVLGAILIDKNAIVEVADVLRPECFYEPHHGLIYEAALELYEERVPIDLVTVAERLKKKRSLTKVGGRAYLTKLANSVPTASHVVSYAQIVKDLFTKRELIAAAAKINEVAFDESLAANEALDQAEQEIFSLSQRHLKQIPTSLREALAESFDRLDELQKMDTGLRGIPSGFTDLDNMLAGFQESNLIILAARPGVGKTAWALNVSRFVAVDKKMPVCFFSLEMSKEELVDRLLVRQADIDAWKMKTGRLNDDDLVRLSEAMGILAEAPFYIDDTPALSILEMRTKARRLQIEEGLKLIVVDYLQLMRSQRRWDSRVQEVSEISQGLKNLARELKVPVLALSQLSRAVEARGAARPRLADLRESGCLTGDTLVLRSDNGEQVPIGQLALMKKPIPIIALDNNFNLTRSLATKVFSTGVKPIFVLKLRSGREIKATANHRFFTLQGWRRLDQLRIGQHLAVPRELRIGLFESTSSINENKLIVLAHLIGDGCYLKRHALQYTNTDLLKINQVKRAATLAFGLKPKVVKQKNWYQLYLTASGSNPLIDWLKKIGVYNQHSFEKVIPSFIFSLPEKQLALFIRHLWAADGCLGKSAGVWRLYYSSTSKKLIDQLQHLLLRFGILSKVKPVYKRGYRPNYHLLVYGKQNQLVFLRKIGIFGKEALVKGVIKELGGKETNPNLDVIPREIWGVIEEARKRKGLTTRQFHQLLGWAYSGTQRHKHGVSRRRLKHILSVINDDFLEKLANSDIYWDEVVAIESAGREEVFDATVPGEHNFVANNIIVHNSIEQDADVVIFLYREDEENREVVTCEVAKHRNGPVGTFQLYFNPKHISFYGVSK